ncbi:MAG TPA: hypothetical protein VFQ67_10515 [Allosphingosinicella sp.]|jgi:hypothetical protein|nr:hypothetical protein [Allosphingosinicella sp.]
MKLQYACAAALIAILGSAAQAQRPVARSVAPSPETGFAVGINMPLTNDDIAKNPQRRTIIVIAYCNATSAPKDLEGWVGKNNPATVQDAVASLSGSGRQTITFVVPWRWHYYINVAQQPGGGIPPGGSCKATAWWVV